MIKCSHCKQEYPEDTLKVVKDSDEVSAKELYFCCHGCEFTYFLLKENNLSSFYARLGDNVLKTRDAQNTKRNPMNFSSINFEQKYFRDKNGLKEVCFIIDGVVCAACVWLNEQILAKLEGIEDIKINYTTHKAKILFDPNKISFVKIYESIQSIGYDMVVYDPKDTEQKDLQRNKIYYVKLVVAIFCAMNVMWVNVGQYSGIFLGIDSVSSSILNLASFVLATPVLFFCASDFYKNAYKGLKNGVVGMELLVITGTTLVYCYSIYAWLSQTGHTYFESVCMIILFVLSAKFLESLSQKSANDNLDKLNAILPLEARLENGELISVHDIKVGDSLLVLPGEMIACDGIIKSSLAMLDYSNISGESAEVTKKCDEEVIAGSIVLLKPVVYEARKAFEDSSISKLAKLLKESEFSTPKIATTAFRIAGRFSRIILGIAMLGFLYHYFIASEVFEHALLIGVSVIVIACPCALALATPIASVVGLNVGFKNHIIYTKADFLESLAKASHVVFDKTGTLTEGKMRVVCIDKINQAHETRNDADIHNEGEMQNKCGLTAFDKKLLIKILKHNPHPVAYAILDFLESHFSDNEFNCSGFYNNDSKNEASYSHNVHEVDSKDLEFELIAGRGFYAKVGNYSVLAGSEELMKERGIIITNLSLKTLFADSDAQKQKSFSTHFYVAIKDSMKDLNSSNQDEIFLKQDSNTFAEKNGEDYALTYIFYLQDDIKEHAKELIKTLRAYKKEVVILSGDREGVVRDVANRLSIANYYSLQTPLQKAHYIQSLIKDSKEVVMVGDGLNDSLALKYAQIGIAMGSGSEVSLQQSDVIILDDKLETLEKGFKIAHKTLKRIHENLLMSLFYNALAIPFALCGFVIPLFAAAFMCFSSICVVINSLRLYRDKL